MEWRRVQVLRPRASTSGGQSAGTDESGVSVSWVVEVFGEEELEDFILIKARQLAIEVQVRQLRHICVK
jgi:hypothetical protein